MSVPQPRDPFKVDEARALAAMELKWQGLYRLKACVGGYEAVRSQSPHITVTAATPDELDRRVLADWQSW